MLGSTTLSGWQSGGGIFNFVPLECSANVMIAIPRLAYSVEEAKEEESLEHLEKMHTINKSLGGHIQKRYCVDCCRYMGKSKIAVHCSLLYD